ncbi:hypothetical protein ACFXGT_37460 [Streptomyces sp. NPDC059352]|uniref:hypothetical protein n=1 Tax=Streptomyces sp. NPDC059352 TaxID=3346810 RepID=UPI0036B9A782
MRKPGVMHLHESRTGHSPMPRLRDSLSPPAASAFQPSPPLPAPARTRRGERTGLVGCSLAAFPVVGLLLLITALIGMSNTTAEGEAVWLDSGPASSGLRAARGYGELKAVRSPASPAHEFFEVTGYTAVAMLMGSPFVFYLVGRVDRAHEHSWRSQPQGRPGNRS